MRSVLLYLVLVGPPLLGLLAILQAGGRIVPPRSVGGDWELDSTSVDGAAASCLGLEPEDGPLVVHVSQSGTRAEVTFRSASPIHVSAALHGDSLIGRGRQGSASACRAGTVGLRARVQGATGREWLRGVLTAGSCTACPVASFVALRRAGESGQ